MKKIFLVIFTYYLFVLPANAQGFFDSKPEFQVSYFGEFLFHSGVKVGAQIPFLEREKMKSKHRKRKGDFNLTKNRQLKLGANLGFYHQANSHNGYLANIELTFQNRRNKSFKPNRYKYFEASVGLGYYRYHLLGTTFSSEGNTLKEINGNGNGNALMPSFSIAKGRNLRFIKSIDVRYFVKPSIYFEIPHGRGVLPHLVLEVGIASSLTSKK